MKILIVHHGKTKEAAIADLEATYYKRIQRYIPLEVVQLPDLKGTKNFSEQQVKEAEAQQLEALLEPSDFVCLLDERGKSYSSTDYANQIQAWMNRGMKRMLFVVGGPYGFDQKIYQRADAKLQLSKMTFSHQIIRCLFAEQLYRAFSILNNEPYHHA